MQAAGACFTVVEDSCSDFSDVLEEDECSNEEKKEVAFAEEEAAAAEENYAASVVALNSVQEFQSALQHIVTERAKIGCGNWEDTFNPRIPMAHHPLA